MQDIQLLFCIQGSCYYSDFKPRLLVFVYPGFNAQIAFCGSYCETKGRTLDELFPSLPVPPCDTYAHPGV